MPLHRRVCFVLAVIAAAGAPATAQSAPAAARALADSFFRLEAAERFQDAARLLDLEQLDARRRQELEWLRKPQPQRHFTAAFFQRHGPRMPRVVAEYQARQANLPINVEPMLRHEFGVGSVDSLALLPAVELGARVLASHDVREPLRRLIDGREGSCRMTPAERAAAIQRLRVTPARILGVVIDDSTAYALYAHQELEEMSPPDSATPPGRAAPVPSAAERRAAVSLPPSILILHRIGGAWRVEPSPDAGGMMSFTGSCRRTR